VETVRQVQLLVSVLFAQVVAAVAAEITPLNLQLMEEMAEAVEEEASQVVR
jgi:hypothetical protein